MDWAALPPPSDPVPPPERWPRTGLPTPEARVTSLLRSLDQELVALLRGVSLECPVCGEFVMHVHASIVCPECGLELRDDGAAPVRLPAGVLQLA